MIYFHIPFCKQKCSYCNFHFSTSLAAKDSLLKVLVKELSLRKNELEAKSISTIYFGGGTPSLLSPDELSRLIDEVLKYFDFNNDVEITLEANPDDLTPSYLKNLAKTPVNRLSIGTQSFFEEDLKLMNRAHNAAEAESSVKRAQDMGITNISIDLIYGSPVSGSEVWKQNLAKTLALEVPHISAYALTVEPRTALAHWVAQHQVAAPREDQQNDDFFYMTALLQEHGFEHYEISNFARPGFHSRHNSAYWDYQPYLGLGPSAHSYDGRNKRSWNIANNSKYIHFLDQGELPSESELLSDKDRFNEMLMIGLRTKKGVDMPRLLQILPEDAAVDFQKDFETAITDGNIFTDKDHLKIPYAKWFIADGIAASLFLR